MFKYLGFIHNFTLLTKSRSDQTQSGVEWNGVEQRYQSIDYAKFAFISMIWLFKKPLCLFLLTICFENVCVFALAFFFGSKANCKTK